MKTIALAPTLRHREQWHMPIMEGGFASSNLTAPQQQLPSIILCLLPIARSGKRTLVEHNESGNALRETGHHIRTTKKPRREGRAFSGCGVS
jgi:hypothetical protein